MPLVRVDPHADAGLERLRAALAERQAELDARATTLSRAKTALETFRIRYVQEVGHLHEELDDLLDAIADAELAIRAEGSHDGMAAGKAAPVSDAGTPADAPPPRDRAPRYTSDAIRKLFRDVAKTIHPDLANDANARDQRHSLMVEANRAYALGDLEQLRRILEAWEGSPEAVQGIGPEATRDRLSRRMAQIEAHLAACAEEIAAIEASPLWRLKAMVDEASAKGKDLVADMVKRLHRDILAARNRLEAMR